MRRPLPRTHSERAHVLSHGVQIGRFDARTLDLVDPLPEAMVLALVGRRLVEAFDRDDLAREVRILSVERMTMFWADPTREGWRLTLSGNPLLPAAVLKARAKRAARDGA